MNQETNAVAAPAAINPAHDKFVDVQDYKFHFKKDELGNKRETIELKLGRPSVEGVVAILEKGGKGH